jgi:glycosyltransferase involved in cell wall biosynthesis
MPRLGGVTAARARGTPEPVADSRPDTPRDRSHALWVRDPRVLLVTQSTNRAAGTGVYAHRVEDALRAQGVTARLVKLSEAFSATDASALRAAIDDLDPHVVHVLHCLPRHLLRLSGLRAERSLVLTVHNLPPQECNVRFGYSWHRLYLLARNAWYAPTAAAVRVVLRIAPPDAVVCVSQPVRRSVTRIIRRGVHVLECPHGPSRGDLRPIEVEPKRVRGQNTQGPERPIKQLVTVGGFIFHKGMHRLIPIMAKLKRDHVACRLEILGRRRDSGYFDFVGRLVARHRLQDMVTLLPDVSDAEIENALRRADIYVQPSLEEGFCLTFLDAALTVPCVIGTDVGAIPEIVALRGATASCVPRWSQTALEDAIRRHLDEPTPHRISVSVDRKLRARYSWPAAAAQLVRIYNLVLATKHVRRRL